RGGGLRVRSRRGVRSVRKRGASAKRKRGGPGAAELNDKGGAGSERCRPRAQPSARGERQRKRKALGPGNTPGRAGGNYDRPGLAAILTGLPATSVKPARTCGVPTRPAMAAARPFRQGVLTIIPPIRGAPHVYSLSAETERNRDSFRTSHALADRSRSRFFRTRSFLPYG